MTLANLYLVGAPKSGTTSLASWLTEHPQVFWSVPKEPFHWAADFPAHRRHYGFETRAAYESLYASPEAAAARWRGDGSTTYLYSTSAVPAILEAVPDARFVVCVREPSALLVSYHRTQVTALNEDETDVTLAWRRSVRGEGPGTTPIDPFLVDYPRVGRVGAALSRLSELVPSDRLHVVVFDDLKADPAGVYAGTLDFLGLPHNDVELVARNASDKAARFSRLTQLGHRPPKAIAPAVVRVRQWSRSTSLPGVAATKGLLWKSAGRPVVPPETVAELRDFFRDDVALLEQTIGRELSAWRGHGG